MSDTARFIKEYSDFLPFIVIWNIEFDTEQSTRFLIAKPV